MIYWIVAFAVWIVTGAGVLATVDYADQRLLEWYLRAPNLAVKVLVLLLWPIPASITAYTKIIDRP